MYIFNITKWVQVDPMDPCKSPSRGQGSVQGTVQEGRLLTGLRQCGLASNCDCTWHTIALCFLASFYQQCKAWRLEARWDKEAEIKSLILVRHSQNWRYPWLFFFFWGDSACSVYGQGIGLFWLWHLTINSVSGLVFFCFSWLLGWWWWLGGVVWKMLCCNL